MDQYVELANKIAENGTALRAFARRGYILSDYHQQLLVQELRKALNNLPDNQEAREIRGFLRSVRMHEPKVVTTTLYGHA